MEKQRAKELKIGIVSILALTIIYLGILWIKDISFMKSDNMYYAEMEDVNGLAIASEVTINGVKVGKVISLDFSIEKQNVIVGFELDEKYKLPFGSYATLTKEMLSSPKMKLMLAETSGRFLNVGDTIKGYPMTDLMEAAGEMIPKVDALLPKLDSILTSLNTITSDPALLTSLHNVETITRQLKSTTEGFDNMMNGSVANLLSESKSVVRNVNNVVNSLARTTGEIKEGDVANLLVKANEAVDNLKFFTDKLNNDSSSMGRLMSDATLYNHLDSTAYYASLLLDDLRQNPKKYVHFSVFGRKDKK